MMKKQLLMLGIFGLASTGIFGQQLHSPAEIFQIMEKSPVSYELDALKEMILPPDRTHNVNLNHYYREVDNNHILTKSYNINSETENHLTRAEEYFNERDFSLARNIYQEVLATDPDYYEVMTYIGQTYWIEGEHDKAIEWYEKTIGLNYIDYMAHWFLADAYKVKGELDKALDEITIAMILNRNNPRIKQSFTDIYQRKKLKTDDWAFTPQIKIESPGENKVRISFDPDWLGYAMVKAVWKYEPGYKESMGVSEGSFSTLEEKECFVSLMATFDKKKLKKYPEFKALQLSLDKQMIDEYIFYEIVLPEHPHVAYQLPEDFIQSIKEYVIEVRGKQN